MSAIRLLGPRVALAPLVPEREGIIHLPPDNSAYSGDPTMFVVVLKGQARAEDRRGWAALDGLAIGQRVITRGARVWSKPITLTVRGAPTACKIVCAWDVEAVVEGIELS